jgi:hypothetical protein
MLKVLLKLRENNDALKKKIIFVNSNNEKEVERGVFS